MVHVVSAQPGWFLISQDGKHKHLEADVPVIAWHIELAEAEWKKPKVLPLTAEGFPDTGTVFGYLLPTGRVWMSGNEKAAWCDMKDRAFTQFVTFASMAEAQVYFAEWIWAAELATEAKAARAATSAAQSAAERERGTLVDSTGSA
jgi:hypothetical protein